jgi:hypothetical protein
MNNDDTVIDLNLELDILIAALSDEIIYITAGV